MSQENVDALRPVYEEWGQGNFRPSSDAYGPDLEWGWSEEFPDIHGVFRDPEPRSSRMVEWLSQWEDWRVEAEEYIPGGDFVVVLCRYTGRGKESGAAVDTTGAHVWTMRGGKPVRLEIFSSRTKALESAGLSEQAMSQENVAHRPLELILARNLLTNTSIPAFLADNRGGLVFYNEAAESLLGMPFQQARNMDPEEWRARFGPFDSARERIPFEEEPLTIALREGRPVHASLYIRSADGEVHHIEVSAVPLTADAGTTGAIGIFWRTEEPSSSASADQ